MFHEEVIIWKVTKVLFDNPRRQRIINRIASGRNRILAGGGGFCFGCDRLDIRTVDCLRFGMNPKKMG
jgi:hypothetical protein